MWELGGLYYKSHATWVAVLRFLSVSLKRMLVSFGKYLVPVLVTFLCNIRDLKNNEISWTIEDMNGAFSGLDKLRRL